MTNMSTSKSTSRPQLQPELFRPSLQYPSYPYAEMLARTAERYPEHVAIVFKDVNLTYRELNALVNSFANALLDLGIGKGQTVCLLMTNRPEYVISWFAITRIGAVASPNEEAGEVPKAFVVLKAGYEQQSAEELMAWANGKLATYKNVREIEFIDAIPRNTSGKILRRVLKEQERLKLGLS